MSLNENGFQRRTYDNIYNDIVARAKELFGENIETSELTPLGKFIQLIAYDIALLEEEAENVYLSRFPNTATGISLDRVCSLMGISRNCATPARYTVKVTGTAGYTIPYGFLFRTESEINFYNVQETTIGTDGICNVTVECTESGTIGNVDYETINDVTNTVAEISSVIGTALVSSGEDDESDYSLRKRFSEAREGKGSCNESSIKSALLRIPTVTSAGVIVNESDKEDSDGRPPHSFECYVTGGESYHTQIAEAIYEKKPIGIKTVGDVTVNIKDSSGYKHSINFSHTTKINVYISVKISIDSDTFNTTSGVDEIKSNLKSYINGLGVGNSVIISSLYGKIHSVQGVDEVLELKLSTDGEQYTSENITINSYEYAYCYDVIVATE